MKKAVTFYSFTVKSPLLSSHSNPAAVVLQKVIMSNLDKPCGFAFWWNHPYQSDPTALDYETKPEYGSSDLASEEKLNCPLLDPQAKHEITKSRQKRDLPYWN